MQEYGQYFVFFFLADRKARETPNFFFHLIVSESVFLLGLFLGM